MRLPRRREQPPRESHEPSGHRVTIRGDFYSPVPNFAVLPDDIWDRRSDMPGVTFDSARQIDWAERELASHIARFEPPPGFRLQNRYFESVDAELCDAILRWASPQRVIELGSGWSTLILRGAARSARVVTYDPYPADFLTDVERVAAQDVPLGAFEELGAGDVLFVDTSHTVKLGGDVNRIVLEVLPRLASGVVVHFHDIWLPYEYHRVLVQDMEMFWAEQYLLQAFLIGNSAWDVMFAAQAVAHEHGDRLQRLVPSYTGASFPSSFWMRRM